MSTFKPGDLVLLKPSGFAGSIDRDFIIGFEYKEPDVDNSDSYTYGPSHVLPVGVPAVIIRRLTKNDFAQWLLLVYDQLVLVPNANLVRISGDNKPDKV